MRKSTPWGYLSALSLIVSAVVIVAVPPQFPREVHSYGAPDRPSYSEIFGQPTAKAPEASIETLAAELVVVTEPSWCSPCRQIEPNLKKLKEAGYRVREIDMAEWRKEHPKSRFIRKAQEKPNDESLFGVPTLFFFSEKGTILNKRVGYQTYELISSLMEKP